MPIEFLTLCSRKKFTKIELFWERDKLAFAFVP